MTIVNNYRFKINDNDSFINIPLEIKWEFNGHQDSVEIYEDEVIKEVIGVPYDFEVGRFSHKPYLNNTRTDINYEFNFFDNTPTGSNIMTATAVDWKPTYLNEGFNSNQVYYYEKPFRNSFFKLDFYSTNDSTTQVLYFTVILPVQQGESETAIISPIIPPVNIRIPRFKLDFVGDKEGFFIYWVKNLTTLKIDTFYMSAKFFNARVGGFMRMMNAPQSIIPNKFNFDTNKYFYYKVNIDYSDFTYSVYDSNNVRVGTTGSIKWYEYVNQPTI